jgi:hypothetical protein
MKKTWRIAVTSSLNDISTNQLENRAGVRGEAVLVTLPPVYTAQQSSRQKFKDGMDGFSSISDICFMLARLYLYTVKKEKKILLIYKEIQSGAVAKSSMRKGFLIHI